MCVTISAQWDTRSRGCEDCGRRAPTVVARRGAEELILRIHEKVEIRRKKTRSRDYLKSFIPAGNRTRILCLEGKYRNHLTTRILLSDNSDQGIRPHWPPCTNIFGTGLSNVGNYNARARALGACTVSLRFRELSCKAGGNIPDHPLTIWTVSDFHLVQNAAAATPEGWFAGFVVAVLFTSWSRSRPDQSI